MSILMQDFLTFAKEKYGYEVRLVPSETPDTFETIFGVSFLEDEEEELKENAFGYETKKANYSLTTSQLSGDTTFESSNWVINEIMKNAA